ncbi:MAG: biopolymer transporter ExbD [Pirellulaceae bacterium]|nr:MAG: biopolymer transporter ExbD [Pirellulaceae bacterium]
MALKTSIHDELPSVNLTPMIDVVFLLIVFFMVGTQFADDERHIDVALPSVGAAGNNASPPRRHTIEVLADGVVLLDGTALTLEQLRSHLRTQTANQRNTQVVVRADGRATHQQVAAVYAVVSQAGIKQLSIAVQADTPRLR